MQNIMKKAPLCILLLLFLIKYSSCSDSLFYFDGYPYPDQLLYVDSLVNNDIFKLRQRDRTIKSVNGYTLINGANLTNLLFKKDVQNLYVEVNKNKFKLQNWVLKDGHLIDGSNKTYRVNEIDNLLIQDKLKLSRLLYFPLVGAAFLGMMPAMWECFDYLFGGEFNKTEVLSFSAVGFTLGIVSSFSKDEQKISFRIK